MASEIQAEKIESIEDFENVENPDQGKADYWKVELSLAEKEVKSWIDRGRNVVKRYRDESKSGARNQKAGYNILWSNVQTLRPNLYSQTPKPVVQRRYKDKDPLGRTASEVLERATTYSCQSEDVDPPMRLAVLDYLLSGRGQIWVDYNPILEKGESGETKGIAYEEAALSYIYWEDFLHSPARHWDEVRWVAKKIYLTRDELKERFQLSDEEATEIPIAGSVGLEDHISDDDAVSESSFKKACVYEIWDKTSKKVCWIAKGYKKILDSKPDPLNLSGFFPCPKPLLATTTTGSLIPIPDYAMYQDQAKELDNITARIDKLTDQIRVRGAYDASYEELAKILDTKVDGQLVPVADFASIAQRGGIDGLITWFPIKESVAALVELVRMREVIKKDLQEITGLSDIVRGHSLASESATAQQIKGQFATLRLKERQDAIQEFVRDGIALVAEIIAEHFQPKTIALMSGYSNMPPATIPGPQGPVPVTIEQVVGLLRNDTLRKFRVDIETDSTIAIDADLERRNRAEFITSVGQFLSQSLPMAQQIPALLPVLGEMLMFGVRAHKTGRNMESSLENAIEGLMQQAQQAQQKAQQGPPPDPKLIEAQQKMQIRQAELQSDQQMEQVKLQTTQQVESAKLQQKAQEMQAELQLEREKTMAELQLKEREMLAKIELEREKAAGQLQVQREEVIGEHRLKAADQDSELISKPRKRLATFDYDEQGRRYAILEDIVNTEIN